VSKPDLSGFTEQAILDLEKSHLTTTESFPRLGSWGVVMGMYDDW